MHTYATDSSQQYYIPFAVAIASIVAAWGFSRVVHGLNITVPWWFDDPAVLGFYGFFLRIFDKWLWRIKTIQKIGLIKMPDINGFWKGYVISSHDGHTTRHNITVEIQQTWKRILIKAHTENSASRSEMAAITTEDGSGITLRYEYVNQPRPGALDSMHIHRGFARLELKDDGRSFEGDYYTGRDRQSFGTLRIERIN